jgi:hypothetical protein
MGTGIGRKFAVFLGVRLGPATAWFLLLGFLVVVSRDLNWF